MVNLKVTWLLCVFAKGMNLYYDLRHFGWVTLTKNGSDQENLNEGVIYGSPSERKKEGASGHSDPRIRE